MKRCILFLFALCAVCTATAADVDTAVCQGGTITLTPTVPPDPAAVCEWFVNDVSVSTSTTYTFSPSSTTEVHLHVDGVLAETFDVKVFPNVSTTETITACDSYTWHGVLYTASTEAPSVVLPSAAGCDSTVTLHLELNQSSAPVTVYDTACDSYVWHGNTYTANAVTLHTYINEAGCDSVVTLNLTIYQSDVSGVVTVNDACDSYQWNERTYVASGSYTFDTSTVHGCDSTVTLQLTVNRSSHGDTTAVACDSFIWYGQSYATSGDYSDAILTNATGCDSIVTLHLLLRQNSDSVNVYDTACDSYTWHGNTYTDNAVTVHTYRNAAGCDSVVTLHLTVYPSNDMGSVIVNNACDVYQWKGHSYLVSGNYAFDTLTVHGCDSTVTLQLTLGNSSYSDTTVLACDNFSWHGQTYTTSGDYSDASLTNVAGCDSTINLHLMLRQNSAPVAVFDTACDFYTWDGRTYGSSINTSRTYSNVAGCDSVVTLHLTILHSSTGNIVESACNGFTWYGTYYTRDTIATHHLTNSYGCDSLLRLSLTINNSKIASAYVTQCNQYYWHGQTYTTSGLYTFDTLTTAGCDSTILLYLTVRHDVVSDTTAVVCESYTWHGQTYDVSGDYSITVSRPGECDSVIALHLTVFGAKIPELNEIVKKGDPDNPRMLVYKRSDGDPEYQYRWYRDGMEIEGATKQYLLLNPGESGEYKVWVADINMLQCGDSVKTTVNQVVSVDEMLAVYPNPSLRECTVFLRDAETTRCVGEVFSASGIRLMAFEMSSSMYQLEHNLPAGTYLLKVTSQDGVVYSQRLIVK